MWYVSYVRISLRTHVPCDDEILVSDFSHGASVQPKENFYQCYSMSVLALSEPVEIAITVMHLCLVPFARSSA